MAEPMGDVVARDDEVFAGIVAPAHGQVGVRVVGVPVIDRHPMLWCGFFIQTARGSLSSSPTKAARSHAKGWPTHCDWPASPLPRFVAAEPGQVFDFREPKA